MQEREDRTNKKIQQKEIWEKKIKRKLQKVKRNASIIIYCMMIAIIMLISANAIRKNSAIYSKNTPNRYDNITWYDDVYYSRDIYRDDDEYNKITYTISKHPILKAWGQIFTKVENKLFPPKDDTSHYYHIVIFQIVVNVIGVIYLYKILKKTGKLKDSWIFLLLTFYELGTATLICTFFAESFLISATLLIMSYYYLSKKNCIASIILGILVTMTTITNCIPFAIMAIILLKEPKKIAVVGGGCVLGTILAIFLLPYSNLFWENVLKVADNNMQSYTVTGNGILQKITAVFNMLITMPFYIFEYAILPIEGGAQALYFRAYSGNLIAIAGISMLGIMGYTCIKNIKKREVLAALGVFLYNMILHGIIGFGLEEGLIYSLHYMWAEVILLGFSTKIENKKVRTFIQILLVLIALLQIYFNLKGIYHFIPDLIDWK